MRCCRFHRTLVAACECVCQSGDHAGSPATLLIQGEPDVIAPASAARVLYWKLVECGVPAVNVVYPLTNHAFDLLLPQTSPQAHAAHYYLERFLGLMV